MAEKYTISESLAADCDTDGAPTLPFDWALYSNLQTCSSEDQHCSISKRKSEAISDSGSSSDSYEAQTDRDTHCKEQSDDDCDSTETANFMVQIENEISESINEDQIVDSLEKLFLEDHSDAQQNVNSINGNEIVQRDSDGDTKLHIAFILESFPYIRKMLTCKNITSYVNVRNDLFQTVFHLAVDKAIKTPIDIILELLRVGADPQIQDGYGRTVLHILCENNDISTLTFLFAMHTEGNENCIRQCLNMHTYDGSSCLHIAVKLANATLLRMLLNWGSDANIRDRKSGRTPLHFAAEAGDIDIVRILVNHPGVDIGIKTYSKESPLILAYHRKHDDVVQLLVDNGAECNLHDIKNFGPIRRKFLKTTNR